MLDSADDAGLVCGFRVDDAGRMVGVGWSEMDAALASEDSVVWLHFNAADARVRDWIERSPRIPAAARAILLGTDAHMRIEAAGQGLTGLVGDLHHDFPVRSDELDALRLYLDSRCLISARRRPLSSIDKLRRSIGEGLTVERPIGLINQFLHHVTDTLGDVILDLATTVDGIEDSLLTGDEAGHGEDLGRVRRTAARLRRHMVPQQHALLGLATRLPGWIRDGDATNLRTAVERLAALGHDLDLVQERARLLQEQISARLAEAANRNIYILSLVTTIFLPMTLVTGLFGMNLGGLPGQSDPLGFWYGVAIMVATGLVTLVALRLRKML